MKEFLKDIAVPLIMFAVIGLLYVATTYPEPEIINYPSKINTEETSIDPYMFLW